MDSIDWGKLVGLILGIIAVGAGVYSGIRASRNLDKAVKEKIEQAESKLEQAPEKAKPAWDLARVTLESYFNRNLSQINYIFWLSVIVMIVGFGTVVWGLSMAFRQSTEVIPAAIASGAGIITQFIGATFLFIYRSTIEQAVNYSKTLERINSVGMAMQILDTMEVEVKSNDLKSKTKATLVELLVRQAYESTEKTQEQKKKASPKTE
jgi:Cyanobacterial TRADD-N associated 2-Transmembrane domain